MQTAEVSRSCNILLLHLLTDIVVMARVYAKTFLFTFVTVSCQHKYGFIIKLTWYGIVNPRHFNIIL